MPRGLPVTFDSDDGRQEEEGGSSRQKKRTVLRVFSNELFSEDICMLDLALLLWNTAKLTT